MEICLNLKVWDYSDLQEKNNTDQTEIIIKTTLLWRKGDYLLEMSFKKLASSCW